MSDSALSRPGTVAKSAVAKPAIPKPARAGTAGRKPLWRNYRDALLGIGTLTAFFAIWQLVYLGEVFPKYAFPSPIQVATALVEEALGGELWIHIGASLSRQVVGVGLAIGLGIPIGLLLGTSATARAALLPLFRLIYPIPGLAWVPLAILWFGIGFTSTVFTICLAGIWPIMFNTLAGVSTIGNQYNDVARVFLAPRGLYIRRILIPACLPFILAGARLTYGVGWRVIIGAEMISSIIGLGFMIDNSRWQMRPDVMIAGMAVIGFIGWTVEKWGFDRLERFTTEKWGMKTPAIS